MWLSEFESQLCGLEKGAWETMLLKMYQWTVAKFTHVKYTPCCDHLLRNKNHSFLDFLLSNNSSIHIPIMCALMPHTIGNCWSRTFTAALKLRGLNSIYIIYIVSCPIFCSKWIACHYEFGEISGIPRRYFVWKLAGKFHIYFIFVVHHHVYCIYAVCLLHIYNNSCPCLHIL